MGIDSPALNTGTGFSAVQNNPGRRVIMTHDSNDQPLLRPILAYAQYVGNIREAPRVLTTSLSAEENHLKVCPQQGVPACLHKTGEQVSMTHWRTEGSFLTGTVCSTENDDTWITFDHPSERMIPHDWPTKFPETDRGSFELVSKKDLGFPSYWRMSRYIRFNATDEVAVLKLIPKQLVRAHAGDEVDASFAQIHKEKLAYEALWGKSKHLILSEVIEDEDYMWIIQEAAPRGSLDDLINREGKLEESMAAHIFKQVVKGIACVHNEGLCHNFLWSTKVLFSEDCIPKILDFGFFSKPGDPETNAKVGEVGRDSSRKEFMPPEQLDGGLRSQAGDMWSLGVILYHMTFGRSPFPDGWQVGQSLTFPKGETLSEDLKSLLNGLIQVDPADRMTVETLSHQPWIQSAPEADKHLSQALEAKLPSTQKLT